MTASIKTSIMDNRTFIKRIAIVVFAIALVAVTVFLSARNYSRANALSKSIDEVSMECEQIKEDIAEKQELINGKGFDEYCEKIAREKYGYAKPGEYVIYDSSYGK